jgi:hypothetical protein
MSNYLSRWDEIRRIEDELELKIHLAGMDARDRWHALQSRLTHLEQVLMHAGEHAEDEIARELSEVHGALRKLRDDAILRAHSNFSAGW